MPIIATEGSYNGKPTITLLWETGKWGEDTRPLSMGVSKCKKVLAAMDQIQAFVDRHKNDPRPTRTQGATPSAAGGQAQGQTNAAPAGPREASYGRTPSYGRATA